MKQIVEVKLELDADMDADDFGQRLVDAARQTIVSNDTVNVVKIQLPDRCNREQIKQIIKPLQELFESQNINNAIFIPLHPDGIKDITIEEIKVTHVKSN